MKVGLQVVVGAMIGGLALTGCSSPGSSSGGASKGPSGGGSGSDMIPIVVAVISANANYLPYYYAERTGIFARNNLTTTEVVATSGTTLVNLVAAGQADFAVSDVNSAALANKRGADVRVATGFYENTNLDLGCRKALNISGTYPAVMGQLTGRSVGITSVGSGTDTFLRYSLISAGVDPAKVNIVPLGAAGNYASAVTSQKIDCVVSPPPLQFTLADQLTNIVSMTKNEGPNVGAAFGNQTLVSQGWATKNPAAVRAWQASIDQSIAEIKASPDPAAIAKLIAPDLPTVNVDILTKFVQISQKTLGAPQLTAEDIANYNKVFQTVNGENLNLTLDSVVVKLPGS